MYWTARTVVSASEVNTEIGPIEPTTSTYRANSKMWGKFLAKTQSLVQDNNPRAAAIIEVKNFLQEPLLGINENPIEWWKQRKSFYPRLYDLAIARLCVVATSVPSERIFSKAGQVITDRRNRLSGDKVKQTLFLHYNM